MNRKMLWGGLRFLVVLAAGTLIMNGCNQKRSQEITGPSLPDALSQQVEPQARDTSAQVPTSPDREKSKVPDASIAGYYWGNYVVSEAYYSLNRYRTGTSTKSWQGLAMSDWDYVASDPYADNRVAAYVGSANRGITGLGCYGFNRGGYCKYFANLVLYRSSYGYPGGHVVLPHGYTYAWRSIYQAQPGWVIQRGGTSPHTAIVVANLGWGLDVIDANWIYPYPCSGGGAFYIARHAMSWSQLSGFGAYSPWENPVLYN